jgi:hypothetical protein
LFSGSGIAADVIEQFCRGQNGTKSQICATRCQANAAAETPTALMTWLSGK